MTTPTAPSTKAKLFKSHDPMLQTSVRGFGLISFFRGRFATRNKELAQAIEEQLLYDPAMRIYIDPEEPEVDLTKDLSTVNVHPAELQAFIYEQQQQQYMRGESTSTQGNIKPASSMSSPLTGGPSGNARMTAAELAAVTSKVKSVTSSADAAATGKSKA